MLPRKCVSAVIVTFESSGEIRACLDSLFSNSMAWLKEVVVIDNCSLDDSAKMAESHPIQPIVIRNRANVGYGRAMNQGAAIATGEYLWLLNPDCTVESESLAELIRFLFSRPQAAACGPMILNAAGTFQLYSRRGVPDPLNSIAYISKLDRVFPRSRIIGGYQLRHRMPHVEAMTDSLSGSCMLVNRDVFEAAGGFDEDYFLFGEDIDLCWKIRQRAYELWYVPHARVVHTKGMSMSKDIPRAHKEFYRSMGLFFDKRLSTRYSPMTRSLVKGGILAVEFSMRCRGRSARTSTAN